VVAVFTGGDLHQFTDAIFTEPPGMLPANTMAFPADSFLLLEREKHRPGGSTVQQPDPRRTHLFCCPSGQFVNLV